jgi:hypothetical protein
VSRPRTSGRPLAGALERALAGLQALHRVGPRLAPGEAHLGLKQPAEGREPVIVDLGHFPVWEAVYEGWNACNAARPSDQCLCCFFRSAGRHAGAQSGRRALN